MTIKELLNKCEEVSKQGLSVYFEDGYEADMDDKVYDFDIDDENVTGSTTDGLYFGICVTLTKGQSYNLWRMCK